MVSMVDPRDEGNRAPAAVSAPANR
jgi:hypothetical protein